MLSNCCTELRTVIGTNQKFYPIVEAIEHNQFSLGLRKACAYGSDKVISVLLEFSQLLKLNPNEQSTNGKDAFAWLKENKSLDESDKSRIEQALSNLVSQSTSNSLSVN